MKVKQIVLDHLLKALEKGTVPWRRPYNIHLAMNMHSGKAYRGVNQMLLNIGNDPVPAYLSFKQAQELVVAGLRKEGHVLEERKGRRGTYLFDLTADEAVKPIKKEHLRDGRLVVFFTTVTKENEEGKLDKDGNPATKTFPIMRYYKVYSVGHLNLPKASQSKVDAFVARHFATRKSSTPVKSADKLVNKYVDFSGVQVKKHEGIPHYTPLEDTVFIPDPKSFTETEGYYSTLFHELGHSTGIEPRLNRYSSYKHSDKKEYSEEELVAEITASLLSGFVGIQRNEDIENSASYINGWMKYLKDEPNAFFKAAAGAQKAMDLILGIEPTSPVAPIDIGVI